MQRTAARILQNEAGISKEASWERISKGGDLQDSQSDKSLRRHEIGLWVDQCKMGSIGVHLSRHQFSEGKSHHLSSHGISLNILPDVIPWFDQIAVCGIRGRKMGSFSQVIHELTQKKLTDNALFEACTNHFVDELCERDTFVIPCTNPPNILFEFLNPKNSSSDESCQESRELSRLVDEYLAPQKRV